MGVILGQTKFLIFLFLSKLTVYNTFVKRGLNTWFSISLNFFIYKIYWLFINIVENRHIYKPKKMPVFLGQTHFVHLTKNENTLSNNKIVDFTRKFCLVKSIWCIYINIKSKHPAIMYENIKNIYFGKGLRKCVTRISAIYNTNSVEKVVSFF